MPRKKKTVDEIVPDEDGLVAWDDYVQMPETVRMTRADKGEIDVPADQVERYKASSWKLV